jgi:hypothetical protein
MYRQGDVLIVPIEKLPTDMEPVAREGRSVVLSQGEATGHAHAIRDTRATLFRDLKLATIFMLVSGEEPIALEHEEHDTIAIPPGKYSIVRQREYIPNTARTVAD